MNLGEKKTMLIGTVSVFLILCLINVVVVETQFREFFSKINSPYFEPLLIHSLSIMVCTIIASLFSENIFQRWYKIFRWAVLAGLLITFLTDAGVSYAFISRTGMATLLGELFILATLGFALVQRFYFKR